MANALNSADSCVGRPWGYACSAYRSPRFGVTPGGHLGLQVADHKAVTSVPHVGPAATVRDGIAGSHRRGG